MPEMDFARDPRLMIMAGGLSTVAIALQLWFRPTYAAEKGSAASLQSRKRSLVTGTLVMVVFLIVTSGLYALSHDVLVYRRTQFPDYPRLSELSIAFIAFALLTIGRIIAMPIFQFLGRVMTGGKATEQQQQRFSAQLWKTLYHSGATLAPLIILRRGASWWPPGIGSPEEMFENYPFVPVDAPLNVYYLVQLGWSLHSLLVTLLQAGRGGYLTMITHHMATQMLVFGSYFIQNNLRLGTEVFFVHDICDVPVCISRMLLDIGYAKVASMFYILLMITWALFRLVLFPFSVIRNVSFSSFTHGWIKWEDAYGWIPLTLGLFILVILHIRWFIELWDIGARYFRSGIAKDTTEHSLSESHAQPSSSQHED